MRLTFQGHQPITRPIAIEAPVAIEVDGIGYAVMMATPTHLEAFARGFALTERLADTPTDILDIDPFEAEAGWIVRVTLAPRCRGRVHDRVRHRTTDASCGLCGIASLEQLRRPLPAPPPRPTATREALFAALAALRAHQPLNAATGAVHAAALCDADGSIRLAREDVGRHNAFDKLNGAMLRQGLDWDGGFALLTARCSFELVEKAVLADCPLLVTVSMATSLAIARAADAGLRLVTLARADAMLAPRAEPV